MSGHKKEVNNLRKFVLYTYDISGLPSSKKVRFVYLLKGRYKQKGLINELGGKFLVPGCFIIPFDKDTELQEVFKLWEVKKFVREEIYK